MIAALVLAGWFILGLLAALIVGPVLRRNAKRYPPARPPLRPPSVKVLPLTPEQERQLYIAYRQTAAMQPGGLIVSRRA